MIVLEQDWFVIGFVIFSIGWIILKSIDDAEESSDGSEPKKEGNI